MNGSSARGFSFSPTERGEASAASLGDDETKKEQAYHFDGNHQLLRDGEEKRGRRDCLRSEKKRKKGELAGIIKPLPEGRFDGQNIGKLRGLARDRARKEIRDLPSTRKRELQSARTGGGGERKRKGGSALFPRLKENRRPTTIGREGGSRSAAR